MVIIAILGLLLFIVMAAFSIVGALVVFGVVEDEKRRDKEQKNNASNDNDND